MSPGWFVTGTDTGSGKTTVSCLLLQSLYHQAGLQTLGMKPVATGMQPLSTLTPAEQASYASLACRWPQWAQATVTQGINEDVLHLLSCSTLIRRTIPDGLSPVDITPYGFKPAIAPHVAAEAAGVDLAFAPVAQALGRLQALAQAVVVEGAGGFRVPLGDDGDMADLCRYLKLPLLLVVGVRLGCINHALLTLESIQARGLPLRGWVGSLLEPTQQALEQTLDSLHKRLPVPCLGVVPTLTPAQRSALYTGAGQQVTLQSCGQPWCGPFTDAKGKARSLLDVLDVPALLAAAPA